MKLDLDPPQQVVLFFTRNTLHNIDTNTINPRDATEWDG
jgi:hypothetical protein